MACLGTGGIRVDVDLAAIAGLQCPRSEVRHHVDRQDVDFRFDNGPGKGLVVCGLWFGNPLRQWLHGMADFGTTALVSGRSKARVTR
jgi:hypothetical protein